MKLFTSNRLEVLADRLAEIISAPSSSPLEQEVIVVQSRDMEKWLSLELATRLGICANIAFPFPNSFVNEAFRTFLPDAATDPRYDLENLPWLIMKLLPQFLGEPSFSQVTNYVHSEAQSSLEVGPSLRSYQLALRIASVFDEYLAFRPEIIRAWEKGTYLTSAVQIESWQRELWTALVGEAGASHKVRIWEEFKKAAHGQPSGIRWSRVFLFGITTLPRFHLDVFVALARHIDVNLFLMSPSSQFWFDTKSDHEIGRVMEKMESEYDQGYSLADLYFDRGNTLLASLGGQGRDFFRYLLDCETEQEDLFAATDISKNSLLAAIQDDILNMTDRTDLGRMVISADDDSLRIHSCHSPLREVQVLHDQLLYYMEKDPGLLPKDIIVMTPEIDTYAPFIEAVFGAADEKYRIPFTIADRTLQEKQTAGTIIDKIFMLCCSRFTAPEVFSLLEQSAVRMRFELSEKDLELIRSWIIATRIRWGIDGQDRTVLGIPAVSGNTWSAGLDRLLLGYALPGENRLFRGILPYDGVEGNQSLVLGKFVKFIQILREEQKCLAKPKELAEWSAALSRLVERFLPSDDDQWAALDVRNLTVRIKSLENIQRVTGFGAKIGVETIRRHLTLTEASDGKGYGFLRGGITFCGMVPMRSIPAKVICLLGINGKNFPRQDETLSFDLRARFPRRGDRSRREDDRYLFLETLLSAREKLFISYVGQSIGDNGLIPPSVLVAELTDYIERHFCQREGNMLDRVVVRHRLQGYDKAYFEGNEGMFSYSMRDYRAACAEQASPRRVPSFAEGKLSDPPEAMRDVALGELLGFYRNPARYLLRNRLVMSFPESEEELQERDILAIEGLERYKLAEDILKREVQGEERTQGDALTAAAGLVPLGEAGSQQYHHLAEDIHSFALAVKGRLAHSEETFRGSLDLGKFRLSGAVQGIGPHQLFFYRYAKLRGCDHLDIWIRLLFANAVGAHLTACLMGKDGTWEYAPPADPLAPLEVLLDNYWKGLSRPLRFYPEASFEYARRLNKGASHADSLAAAKRIWTGNDHNGGESRDLYLALCHTDNSPFDADFQKTSMMILNPLLLHQSRVAR
ncbi:MAG: exodeoxyribonuclease V subunit gamma [Smithellaceae bacterium]|nr:exodeoxyribonuclease V subunit gamma [Smithellaceae bacterium]